MLFDTFDTIASLKDLAKALIKTPEICPAVALATLAYACKQEGMLCANWLTRRARLLAQQPSTSEQPLFEIQRTFLRIAPNPVIQQELIARVITNTQYQLLVATPLLAILPATSRRCTAHYQHADYKLALTILIRKGQAKLLDTLLFDGLGANWEEGQVVPNAIVDLSLVALAVEQDASDRAITALMGGKQSTTFFALQNSNALLHYCHFDFVGNARELGIKGMFRGKDCGRKALLQFLDENIGLGNMTL